MEIIVRVFTEKDNGNKTIMLGNKIICGEWRYFAVEVPYYSRREKRPNIELEITYIPETLGVFAGYDSTKWEDLSDDAKSEWERFNNEALSGKMESERMSYVGMPIFDNDIIEIPLTLPSYFRTFNSTYLAVIDSPTVQRCFELYRDYENLYDPKTDKVFTNRGHILPGPVAHQEKIRVIGNKFEHPNLLACNYDEGVLAQIKETIDDMNSEFKKYGVSYELILNSKFDAPILSNYSVEFEREYDNYDVYEKTLDRYVRKIMSMCIQQDISMKFSAIVSLSKVRKAKALAAYEPFEYNHSCSRTLYAINDI